MSSPIVPCLAYREHGYVCALGDGHEGDHLAQRIAPTRSTESELRLAARMMRGLGGPVNTSGAVLLEVEASFCDAEGVPPTPHVLTFASAIVQSVGERVSQAAGCRVIHEPGAPDWCDEHESKWPCPEFSRALSVMGKTLTPKRQR